MPSESELRDLLGTGHVTHDLDPQRIIAQSRRRRMPRQIGAGVVGVMAMAGVVVIAVPALQPQPPAAISSLESGQEGGTASDSAVSELKRSPAELLNECSAAAGEVEPNELGLQLDVEFPASAPIGAGAVTGTVRLTNTGSETVAGTTALAPAITVSQDGVTVWHSLNVGELSAIEISLLPGESLEYTASFDPVRCSPDDDLAGNYGIDRPALDPGSYELSAALDFSPDPSTASGASFDLVLVTGPRSTILLQ